MQPFELLEPRSLDEALELLASDPDARPLAGGTAMVVMLKQGLLRPDRLLNLRRIAGLAGIAGEATDELRIGAMTSIRDIESHPALRSAHYALADACHQVANVRIRNLATIGGNLAHADYQSDPPTILCALDARVRIRSAVGSREEPLRSFLVSGYQTTLEPDELVTEVVVPPLPEGYTSRYMKFTTRSAEDRPCVGIGIVLAHDGDRCVDLRVVVGAVSPTPVRAVDAERVAIGAVVTEAIADEVGARAASATEPIDDVRGSADYKRRIIRTLVRRMLLEMAGSEVAA